MKTPSTIAADKLKLAGVRSTKQRLEICEHLFAGGNRHVSAEHLWGEVRAAGSTVSLATIYNTLNELRDAGLLIASRGDNKLTVFDTNVLPHHHAVDIESGEIYDLPADCVSLNEGSLPEGFQIEGVQLVVRVRRGD